MSKYEQLPIFRAAYDFALHIDTVVHGCSRYHKYGIGEELRAQSRLILKLIIRAHYVPKAERPGVLLRLRYALEECKITIRLAHDTKTFLSLKQYLHIAEQLVHIIKQNEGWLKQARL